MSILKIVFNIIFVGRIPTGIAFICYKSMAVTIDGDVLLVQNAEGVEVGEAGIFVLDGSGYFKVYGGDCLISLNPEYGRIMLKDFENVSCIGKVLGSLQSSLYNLAYVLQAVVDKENGTEENA